MLKKILLLSPDPAEGGNLPPTEKGPAATAVIEGGKTERELQLEKDLAGEKTHHAQTTQEKKDRETRIAELEGELHTLKNPPAPEKPKSEKVRAFGFNFGD